MTQCYQVVEGVKHVIGCLSESNYAAQINNRRIAVLAAYLHCLLLISEVKHLSPSFRCFECSCEKRFWIIFKTLKITKKSPRNAVFPPLSKIRFRNGNYDRDFILGLQEEV